MIGALHGIRVLDLSSVILGPMTAQYLGDLGADVIKVEAPEGDITRSIGPRRHEGMGALFMANNRNTRSIILDLKDAGSRATLRAPRPAPDAAAGRPRDGWTDGAPVRRGRPPP